MSFQKIFVILLGISVFLIFGCGPKAVTPKATLDTPLHHVTNGNKLLKAGKIDNAFREFSRAKALGPKYSPAYVGLGICYGYKEDFRNGLVSMENARKYIKNKAEEVSVGIGYIRLYLMGKERLSRHWLMLAEAEYDKLKNMDLPELFYYMGLAYKMSYQFKKAEKLFSRVLEMGKGYTAETDTEYAIIQKIERAMPGSEAGKKIAIVEKITRADAAALLVEELNIEKLFKANVKKRFDTTYKPPGEEFDTSASIEKPPVTDIMNHVLRTDIETVITLGIKGLQPFPDYSFKPEKILTRAEYAMMMEDILIQISGELQLSTQFVGSTSPFPDLRNDLPLFNAVMTCTSRGIMTAMDLSTGEFNPMGGVSGVDALLGIRALKSQL